MPAKRNDRVAPPGPPDGWEARFATTDAAKGWEDLVAVAKANTWEAFVVLTTRPTEPENRARQHRLRGRLGSHDLHGKTLEQWQYEVTAGGRIWYCPDPDKRVVWLVAASTSHPKATDLTHVGAAQRPVLPLTGERTVPGIAHENYWFRRHEAVYRALLDDARDAVVLDAGAGEGYGSAMLADVARRVLAVEGDGPTAAHAARRYPSVSVTRADLQALPVRSSSVDVVVNLQVIEHLHDQPGFLAECARVLRPGGRLHCATPNRLTFSPGAGPGDVPLNPFHTRELDAGELAALVLDAGFSAVTLRGLHHGPVLRQRDARHGGLVDAQIALALSGDPWPEALAADVAAVSVDEFLLTTDEVDASLDLLVTAVAAPG